MAARATCPIDPNLSLVSAMGRVTIHTVSLKLADQVLTLMYKQIENGNMIGIHIRQQ